jgi:hypothetical protein
MSPSLSYDELIALKPCGATKWKALFKNGERLTAREALAAGASISDLAWVAGRLGLKRQCAQFALACAKRVAHLNTDPRVQAALSATQTWIDNPSDLNADAAADAAAYAAYAAYAANAAASAAYAAAHAINVYDAAANADNAAKYAASAAADDAEREEQKRIFLEIFDPL